MNRTWIAAGALALVTTLQATASLAQTQHLSKSLSLLQVPASGCVFFQLDGVTQADPGVTSSPWLAIDMTQSNGPALYALLLSVRHTGSTISRVLTSGTTACGEAKVLTIDF